MEDAVPADSLFTYGGNRPTDDSVLLQDIDNVVWTSQGRRPCYEAEPEEEIKNEQSAPVESRRLSQNTVNVLASSRGQWNTWDAAEQVN